MPVQMPMISVIVPVYNAGTSLDACLESIVGQSFQDIEILLIDDGSTDGSAERCSQWAQKDPRIRVLHRENGGVSAARNTGLSVMRGSFFGFVDADDTIHPDMFLRLYTLIKETQTDLAVCQYLTEEQRPKRIAKMKKVYRAFGTQVIDSIDAIRYFLKSEQIIGSVVWNKLYRSTLLELVTFPEGVVYEDNEVTLRVLMSVPKIAVTGEIMYYKTKRAESITHTNHIKNLSDRIRSVELIEKTVREHYSGQTSLIRELNQRTIATEVKIWMSLERHHEPGSRAISDQVRGLLVSRWYRFPFYRVNKYKTICKLLLILTVPRLFSRYYLNR
ncbi:MAG: glycosyltransferase [Oscillospiraceae bacterium]|nr:glycosyltransferase [Oscillospiraceae bacterium]